MTKFDFSYGLHIFRDGSMWCAVGPAFRNLQEDKAGFGKTPRDAYTSWWGCNRKEPIWQERDKPAFLDFIVHP